MRRAGASAARGTAPHPFRRSESPPPELEHRRRSAGMIASALMGFEFDDRSWPIVRARWAGTSSDRDVDAALGRIDEYLNREERFGLLIDSRGGGGFSPEDRKSVV